MTILLNSKINRFLGMNKKFYLGYPGKYIWNTGKILLRKFKGTIGSVFIILFFLQMQIQIFLKINKI